MDWYKKWFGSPFYKILYQNRDEFEAQEFIEYLLRYLQPLPGSTMLDIACGEGYGTASLAKAGAASVVGVDISADSVDHATKKYGIRAIVGSAQAIPLPAHRGGSANRDRFPFSTPPARS